MRIHFLAPSPQTLFTAFGHVITTRGGVLQWLLVSIHGGSGNNFKYSSCYHFLTTRSFRPHAFIKLQNLKRMNRFLLSFSGKYLAHDCRVAILDGKSEAHSCDHQLCKINIPHIEPAHLGPVENEMGLSNFIPLLFGDAETCSEMQMMQQRFEEFLCSKRHQVAVMDAVSESCEVFALKQAAMSELILGIGWLLKEPKLETGISKRSTYIR